MTTPLTLAQLPATVQALTPAEVFRALAETKSNGNTFMQNLVQGFMRYGNWTDKQKPWAYKMAGEILGLITRNQPAPVKVNSTGITGLFDVAVNNRLKFPKITLSTVSGQKVKLQLAGERSKYAGQVLVTDGGRYPDNVFFGRISEGQFFPASRSTDEVRDLLEALSDNPAEVAAAYGRKTGACCFCCRALDNAASVRLGYGPVCAKKYGLPH